MPVSFALVAAQMAALAALLWPWQAAYFDAAAWPILAVGAALGAWTLAHNRPGNFSVLPEPRASARLVTSGPYALVRHPMYSAVIVGALALAIGWNTVPHWVAFAALVAVLNAKARREERLLVERFPDYAAYMARTPRFVPRLRRGAR